MTLPRALVPLVAILTLAACPAPEPDPASDAPPLADAPDPASPAEDPTRPVCLRGEPFVESGPVTMEADAVAGRLRVSSVRWARHDGCERVVIQIQTEGGNNAAGPGRVAAELLRGVGVVRVSLRDVEAVDAGATDARFGGPLARSSYAVTSPDGGFLYVDIHLGDAAEAHVATLGDPARVVVDLRPGGAPLPPAAATGPRVVVLEPRPGRTAYPLTITGYARTFEANVVARLLVDGEPAGETFTTATGYIESWGHFSMTFESGPSGPVLLQVGEYSAKDGTWEGAAIRLR